MTRFLSRLLVTMDTQVRNIQVIVSFRSSDIFFLLLLQVVLQLPEILSSEEVPHLSGGGLPGIYNFDNLHFHWGSDSNRGSEHRISNQA